MKKNIENYRTIVLILIIIAYTLPCNLYGGLFTDWLLSRGAERQARKNVARLLALGEEELVRIEKEKIIQERKKEIEDKLYYAKQELTYKGKEAYWTCYEYWQNLTNSQEVQKRWHNGGEKIFFKVLTVAALAAACMIIFSKSRKTTVI